MAVDYHCVQSVSQFLALWDQPTLLLLLVVVLNSIHLEGQGRQPPAITAQPPAAFTLEG